MNNSNDNYYNTLYRLWSVIALGAGTRQLWELTAQSGSAEELYIRLSGGEGPTAAVKAARDIPLGIAEKMMEQCENSGIDIISNEDERYPEKLRRLYNAPPVIFCKGDISGIDDRLTIAVVGARKPSKYSLRVTSGLVSSLSRHGFDIVSGFAEGIDICAHLTAVKYKARTYAVLGCGINTLYPKANEKYKELIAENGAVISEFLPQASPYPANFPVRNRIIAALSDGIAVIEAGAKSGSLNTATHGAEQGKTVFAVAPADLFDERYSGNADLIRKGVVPLMGVRDIYNEYRSDLPHTIVENDGMKEQTNVIDENAVQKGQTEVKEQEEKIVPQSDDPIQNAIISALSESESALRADDIAQICDAGIEEILTTLTDMEIDGLIKNESGTYSLSRQ